MPLPNIATKIADAAGYMNSIWYRYFFETGVSANVTREQLTANRTYYVRNDGSDSNTGIIDSSTGAFATWAKAIDVATLSLDCNGFQVTIECNSGTDWGNITVDRPLIGTYLPLVLKNIEGGRITLKGFARVKLDGTVTLDIDQAEEATGLTMIDRSYLEFASGSLFFGQQLAVDFETHDYAFFNADGDYETRMNAASFKYVHGDMYGHSRYKHDSGTGVFWNTDNPRPPDPGQGTYVFQTAVFSVSGTCQLTANGPNSYTGSVDDVTASELLPLVQVRGPFTALIGNMSSITEGQANFEFPAGFFEILGAKGCAYVDDDNNDLGRFHFIDGIMVSDVVMGNYDPLDPTVGGYYGGYMGKGTGNFKNGAFEQGYRLGSFVVSDGTTTSINFAAFVTLYGSDIRRLRVEFSLIAGTDGTQLQFRSSADGTTFDSGGTDYSYQNDEIDSATSAIAGSNGASGMLATTATIGNAATEQLTGWIEVADPSGAARWPEFSWELSWIDNSATPRLRKASGSGARRAAGLIKGIQFVAAAGSISSVSWSVHHTQGSRLN